MNVKSIAAVLLAFAFAASAASAAAPAHDGATPGEWTMDFDAAKSLAADTGRPILLNFTGSDWCGWCIQMERRVFSRDAWISHAKENLVLVWIDFPRNKSLVPEKYASRNAELARTYGVQGYPSYVLLDSDGKTVLGRTGATADASPDSFIRELETIRLTSPKSVEAIRAKLAPKQLAKLDSAGKSLDEARQKLDDWIQTGPVRNDANTALFNEMRENIDRAEAAYLRILKSSAP